MRATDRASGLAFVPKQVAYSILSRSFRERFLSVFVSIFWR
jgi:hypothetical protein